MTTIITMSEQGSETQNRVEQIYQKVEFLSSPSKTLVIEVSVSSSLGR